MELRISVRRSVFAWEHDKWPMFPPLSRLQHAEHHCWGMMSFRHPISAATFHNQLGTQRSQRNLCFRHSCVERLKHLFLVLVPVSSLRTSTGPPRPSEVSSTHVFTARFEASPYCVSPVVTEPIQTSRAGRAGWYTKHRLCRTNMLTPVLFSSDGVFCSIHKNILWSGIKSFCLSLFPVGRSEEPVLLWIIHWTYMLVNLVWRSHVHSTLW